MSDTTRINATAPSRVDTGQQTGRAAAQAEKRKIRDYDKKRLKNSFNCPGPFIPVAYEVHGTWGEGATEALQTIQDGAKLYMSNRAASRLKKSCRASIAVEIQRGNARIQRVGLDRARSSKFNLLCELAID